MRRIAAAVVIGVLMGAPATANAATFTGNYTPDDPSVATLAGSLITCQCASDKRFLDYDVRVTAPEGETVSGDAVLALELGTRTVNVPLGELENGAVSGRLPWPGDPADPGAVDTVVDATVTVDGAAVAPLPVSIEVPDCASSFAAGLAATGLAGWVAPLGVLGALLVALGIVVRTTRRSRSQ